MASISVGAVAATLVLALGPMYLVARREITGLNGRRLTAIAASTAASVVPDSLDVIARPEGQNTMAFVVARQVLVRLWEANGGDARELTNGIAIVRRDGSRYRYLVNSAWSAGAPQYSRSWEPPPGLVEAVARGGGVSDLFAGPNGVEQVSAAVPVSRADGSAAGYVVVTLDADRFLDSLRRQLARIAWIPALVLLVALVASLVVARRVTHGIEAVAQHAVGIARGDLRGDLSYASGDEVGALADAFRAMTAELRTLLGDVETVASEVAATADELAAGAQQMTASTEEVAGAAQSIAGSAAHQTQAIGSAAGISTRVAERARSVVSSAAGARDAAELATGAAQRAAQAAADALVTMDAITSVTRDAMPAVAELGEKSARIGQLTDTIAGIAQQTNLLALNAAIEAARAGEQGRGFAVVAGEVRKLARDSARALETIRALAAEMRSASTRTAERITTVGQRVAEGEEVIRSSTDALSAIVASIEGSRGAVARIVESADAQHAEADALARDIASIAVVAEQNASTSEQVSAVVQEQTASMAHVAQSSQHLADIAARLKGTMTRFSM